MPSTRPPLQWSGGGPSRAARCHGQIDASCTVNEEGQLCPRCRDHINTLQEYLESERAAEHKSEYYNGEIIAIPRASLEHSEIVGQLWTLISQHLRARGCRFYSSDMRVATPNGLYTYPDLSVICGTPQWSSEDRDTLINPVLLVEVLSPSTETYDRGRKAHLQREVESLQELLLISQHTYEVELNTRRADGRWSLKQFKGIDAAVELISIGYTLPLRELYEYVADQLA